MTSWEDVADSGEDLVDRARTLLEAERWDLIPALIWAADTPPIELPTDAERIRLQRLIDATDRLSGDLAELMTATRSGIDGMPLVRKASAAYLANVTEQ